MSPPEASGYGVGSAARLQLREQVADVALHRLLAEEEPRSDLAVDQTVRDQLQHLDLPGRRLLPHLGNRRGERDDFAAGDAAAATVSKRPNALGSGSGSRCAVQRPRFTIGAAPDLFNRRLPPFEGFSDDSRATAASLRRQRRRRRADGDGEDRRPARPRGRRACQSSPSSRARRGSAADTAAASRGAAASASEHAHVLDRREPTRQIEGGREVLGPVGTIRRATRVRSAPSRRASALTASKPSLRSSTFVAALSETASISRAQSPSVSGPSSRPPETTAPAAPRRAPQDRAPSARTRTRRRS